MEYFDLEKNIFWKKEPRKALQGAKYISFFDKKGNVSIVVFNPEIQHAEMLLKISYHKVLGAGFVDITNNKVYGESMTLGIGKNEVDDIVLKMFLDKFPEFQINNTSYDDESEEEYMFAI